MPTKIRFLPLPTDKVRQLQANSRDANGQLPERKTSDGSGVLCRHCLRAVAEGRDYLIVAHRPFDTIQPYAEVGPIFLCAEICAAPLSPEGLPDILDSPHYIVRGYSADERIVYGSGKVTPTDRIIDYSGSLLDDPEIAFVHIRSASNNCYHLRIERSGPP